MNIQEAIETGKPFKRKSWTHADYLRVKSKGGYGGGELFWVRGSSRANLFYVSDILADNWEVEERKVEVTERQVRDAMEKVHKTVTTPCEVDLLVSLLELKD